jgi:hypothetical protein
VSSSFANVTQAQQAEWEDEILDRFGADAMPAVAESRARAAAMTPADANEIQRELEERERAYADLLRAGIAPDDQLAQALTAEHYCWVRNFWTPTAESFAGLGDIYVDHPGFRARYEAIEPGLAEYVRDAMTLYAIEGLA